MRPPFSGINMIRVLQIVTSMNRGGLETMIMNYYRQIDKNRIQFDFLEHRDFKSDYTDEILAMGGKIYKVPRQNPLSSGYKKALDDFFAEHNEYDIVHSHIDCMSADPILAAKNNGVKVRIAHSHNSNQTKDLKYPLKMICKRKIPGVATELFACGKEAGEFMYDGKPFTIMNNAIDTSIYEFDEAKREAKRKELLCNLTANTDETFVVGHVGRMEHQKNHNFLIDVFAEIKKIRENSVLILAGTGSLEKQLMEKVDSLGLKDSVMFLGTRDDVPELLMAMDVFLFPSHFEGLPLTVVEAEASGLPVVMSDVITKDCILTSDVVQMSLKGSAKAWAKKVVEAGKFSHSDDRKHKRDDVISGGFDIVSNSEWLMDYYESKLKEV